MRGLHHLLRPTPATSLRRLTGAASLAALALLGVALSLAGAGTPDRIVRAGRSGPTRSDTFTAHDQHVDAAAPASSASLDAPLANTYDRPALARRTTRTFTPFVVLVGNASAPIHDSWLLPLVSGGTPTNPAYAPRQGRAPPLV